MKMNELEKAARAELPHNYVSLNREAFSYDSNAMLNMFRKGAQWQAMQSPWISVKERLPEHDNGQSLCEVLVKTCDGRCSVIANICVEDMMEAGGATHWMEIPELPKE